MSRLRECPPPEKLALLWEDRLTPQEREEILLHVAGCNGCALEYSIFASLVEAKEEAPEETAGGQCPPPEIFALLLENKLEETEKADVLRHMAGCN